ncbi:tRNA pseudouridine(38/39) synthase [Varanus komodoensis]|uniref:tRNA pseudouridine(38/39) synthase n=1 Tax=Varanus komodoensis TaxID=61221 RepID=A0A8D2IX96_VARKO|nr:tRNA pseudouridine(38/39) synthase [Varanus komodoensis]XP_044293550.1 tRNA pseudouridine(38/39) synthase [Varanus komodoensis]XP_044293551.1 tRNA pseudouridine(38/39) synthase [Varanus komodoensis]KAF7242222.1 tRNA pseudouridine(38/39) synthase [Varanus komodoensis]
MAKDGEEREKLLKRVQELEETVQRLEAKLWESKEPIHTGMNLPASGKPKKRLQRPFDFSAYDQRHVALKIAYLGWGYQGFASQENTNNTIEQKLFEALGKTRLVESRQASNYHRCGRTDKGVSAFGQVISLDLRSNFSKTKPEDATKNKATKTTEEIHYTHILNQVLPPDIRVLAWAPVEPSFSARFSCLKRTYRYFFPQANLGVCLMNTAAQKFVGTHDFRNLCKMDVANGVTNFQRTVLKAEVQPVDKEATEQQNPFQMYQFEVTGQAFLYHQVRCMMAILFLIGQRMEKPEIIDELLDIEKNPRKPQYSMAVEFPLVLYDCEFENIQWIYDRKVQEFNVTHFQQLWANHAVKTHMLYSMLKGLDFAKIPTEPDSRNNTTVLWREITPPIHNQISALIEGVKARNYKPLMDRPKCEGLESRISHFVRRGRIEHPHIKKEKHSEMEIDEKMELKSNHGDTPEAENKVPEQAAKRLCMSTD